MDIDGWIFGALTLWSLIDISFLGAYSCVKGFIFVDDCCQFLKLLYLGLLQAFKIDPFEG
jgi:hypothetical protein